MQARKAHRDLRDHLEMLVWLGNQVQMVNQDLLDLREILALLGQLGQKAPQVNLDLQD